MVGFVVLFLITKNAVYQTSSVTLRYLIPALEAKEERKLQR